MAKIELISLKCPNCGGEMEVSESEKNAKCPYCGHHVLISEKDYEKIAYENRIGKARADAEIREKEKEAERKRLRRRRLVIVVVLAGIVVAALLGSPDGRRLLFPQKADPFAGLEVTYSGVSGDGSLTLTNKNKGDLGKVKFQASPSEHLSNGDEIEISAQRLSGWRWEHDTQQYTVTGLVQPVGAIAELSGEALDEIQNYSETLIDRSWEDVSASGSTVTWKSSRYGMYLLTGTGQDASGQNLLYDCYETVVTDESGGQQTFWQAVCYPDVMSKGDGSLAAEFKSAKLMAWKLGYDFGFSPSSAVYGWKTSAEMESVLTADQAYHLADRVLYADTGE